MIPHITEELWEKLGNKNFLCYEPWPTPDSQLLHDDIVSIAIQVNGKHRATLPISVSAEEPYIKEQVP